LEIAKLYLRSADYTMKKSCGIYEIVHQNGRCSYKIFADDADLKNYLKKNKDKACQTMQPIFSITPYQEYPYTQMRKLTPEEINRYLAER